MKRIIYIFIITLFAILIFAGCQKRKENTVANPENFEFPDQEGWNSKVISTTNGIVGAIIQYGHMQRFKKRKVVEFDQGIVVDFFNEEGEHTSKLTSKNGKLDEDTKNIEAFGNVVVVSDTGITLKTERLRWDNSIEKIVTYEFVTIVTAEQDTFYGNGFESDQNLENWRITGFSGITSRGIDLNFQLSKKKQQSDSITIESIIDTANTYKDTLTVIK